MLRTLEPMRASENRFTCKYCHGTFVHESRYIAHECKQMKREKEFRSPLGQAAWQYYQQWMRSMKRMPPPAGSYLNSKFYRTFINFADFVRRVDLPRPDLFIRVMSLRGFSPTIWTNDEVYALYLEHLDYKATPLEQAKLSIKTLLDYTDKHEIDIDTVFNVMPVGDIIHLLHARKLSPWLLLFSKSFRRVLIDRATTDQKIIIENLIRPEYWSEQFEKHPIEVTTIKKLVQEMGI